MDTAKQLAERLRELARDALPCPGCAHCQPVIHLTSNELHAIANMLDVPGLLAALDRAGTDLFRDNKPA